MPYLVPFFATFLPADGSQWDQKKFWLTIAFSLRIPGNIYVRDTEAAYSPPPKLFIGVEPNSFDTQRSITTRDLELSISILWIHNLFIQKERKFGSLFELL